MCESLEVRKTIISLLLLWIRDACVTMIKDPITFFFSLSRRDKFRLNTFVVFLFLSISAQGNGQSFNL